MPTLIREAGRIFPGTLRALDAWTPLWTPASAAALALAPTAPVVAGSGLALSSHPATVDAVAALLGVDPTWSAPAPASGPGLVAQHPDTAAAVASLLLP
jgi:hypothetical protein